MLPIELHELGKRLAQEDHRNFSGEIAALIEEEKKRRPRSALDASPTPLEAPEAAKDATAAA